MKILVIGWYGTETIGDRAILAGLFSMFQKSFDHFEVKIGSLYPFFTQRTIHEDTDLWEKISGKKVLVEVLHSKKISELNTGIRWADIVVMGGGPLMHIKEVYMIEYAFKKAKKEKKKTALLGCGIGPLFYSRYKKAVLEIIQSSDLVILRDHNSKNHLKAIFNEFHQKANPDSMFISYDPAVECCLLYDEKQNFTPGNHIAINLRKFPEEYSRKNISEQINYRLKAFVENLSLRFNAYEVKLVPMHYFYIGDDDRAFLNEIYFGVSAKNITVQNAVLTLEETMQLYQNAYFNIGMRFHSILMQTILNGKNYILDYSEPNFGKISGFIEAIDPKDFYESRRLSLQKDAIDTELVKDVDHRFEVDKKQVVDSLLIYDLMLRKFG